VAFLQQAPPGSFAVRGGARKAVFVDCVDFADFVDRVDCVDAVDRVDAADRTVAVAGWGAPAPRRCAARIPGASEYAV